MALSQIVKDILRPVQGTFQPDHFLRSGLQEKSPFLISESSHSRNDALLQLGKNMDMLLKKSGKQTPPKVELRRIQDTILLNHSSVTVSHRFVCSENFLPSDPSIGFVTNDSDIFGPVLECNHYITTIPT